MGIKRKKQIIKFTMFFFQGLEEKERQKLVP